MEHYIKTIRKSLKNGRIDKNTCKDGLSLIALEIAMTKVVQAIKEGQMSAAQVKKKVMKK